MHFSDVQRADLVDRIRRLSRPMMPQPTACTPAGRIPNGIRAVLFDLYGTLFISGAGDIGAAESGDPARYVEAAAAAGFALNAEIAGRLVMAYRAEIERQHQMRRAEGVACPETDVRHVWRSVLASVRSGEHLSDEAVLRFAVEVECRINPVWPMPGAREAVDRLRGQGLRLGIVSNAQCFTPLLFDALMGARLEQLGFMPDFCVWSWQLGEAKPSPRLLHKALTELREQHGISPQETLFVGNDMLKDIHPAQRAGCATALFAGDARSLRLRADDPRCQSLTPTLTLVTLGAL